MNLSVTMCCADDGSWLLKHWHRRDHQVYTLPEAKAGLAYGVPAKLARKDGKKSPEHMVWRFTAAWCGVDEKTAAKAMQWLLRHHFIEKVGEYGRTAPGKPGRRVRYLRVSPRSIEGLIAYSARREEIRKAKGLDRSEPVGDEWRE